jgi:hypothetical protein
MKPLSKNLFIGLAVLAANANPSAAVVLSLNPSPQQINVGGAAIVDIIISGLGDQTAPSLGAFDIDLSYDPAVVAPLSAIFGSHLDLGGIGSIQFAELTTPGLIHLDEVSIETPEDLNSLQLGTFTLATLTFNGLAEGDSPLVFQSLALSDENGGTISDFSAETALIRVSAGSPNVLPEPGSTAVTLLISFFGVCTLRRACDWEMKTFVIVQR